MQIAQDMEDEDEDSAGTETSSKSDAAGAAATPSAATVSSTTKDLGRLAITDGAAPTAPSERVNAAPTSTPLSAKQDPPQPSDASTTTTDSRVTSSSKEKEKEKDKKKSKVRLSDKQKEEIKKLSEERDSAHQERVEKLVEKLIERLAVFTESDKKGPVTEFFKEQQTKLAEELKMESFGTDLLHAIGYTYYTKASNFIKSQKLLGIGGIFGKFKEKYTVVKDTWNTISSAIDAQYTLQDIAKLEEKGDELTEAEKAELERHAMGKILAAAWNGSRFEIQSVLREVCDRVLNDKSLSQVQRLDRAYALLIVGDVFRRTFRTKEEEEEVRIFEDLVQEAAASKKKKKEHHINKDKLNPFHKDEKATEAEAEAGPSKE